ncbi:hypothetical protein MC7420_1956 [Coleofasciculus chthonoplastes PCC 7420]|uniref:Uncharacterized protein n=1 Tax=Coleofasciculus chthonoplastes PCC 7420 TaxID=118168 RepID=B4VMV5_9CYAN|nr:hypothetical protein MC7420_1956 [Coleofasciculus chthonoplastes PCC 7420]
MEAIPARMITAEMLHQSDRCLITLNLVICHSSFVIRHSLFVIRHLLFVIRYSSFVIRHSLFGRGGFCRQASDNNQY